MIPPALVFVRVEGPRLHQGAGEEGREEGTALTCSWDVSLSVLAIPDSQAQSSMLGKGTGCHSPGGVGTGGLAQKRVRQGGHEGTTVLQPLRREH